MNYGNLKEDIIMNLQELIQQAYDLIEEAYNQTDYNTNECDKLSKIKALLEDMIE